MFKKVAAFLFALGLGASAFAYEPDECEYQCFQELNSCTSTMALCTHKFRLCMSQRCNNFDYER